VRRRACRAWIRLTRYTGHDPKFKADDGTEKAIVDADLP